MFFFFFNDTATTEIYTLSLHDALPILSGQRTSVFATGWDVAGKAALRHEATDAAIAAELNGDTSGDRKSTRLNSSHANISYAVFCLKKKKTNYITQHRA